MNNVFPLNLPKATPTLEGEDVIKFLEQIEKDLEKPTGLIPTPKLNEALRLIKKEDEPKGGVGQIDI